MNRLVMISGFLSVVRMVRARLVSGRSSLAWRVSVALLVTLSALAGCATTPGAQLGRYDFQYSATGDVAVRPYQVFDDGTTTYLQFKRPLAPTARVLLDVPSGQLPQSIDRQGQVVSVPSIANRLTITDGSANATVNYTGPARRPRYVIDTANPVAGTSAANASGVTTASVPDADVTATPIAASTATSIAAPIATSSAPTTGPASTLSAGSPGAQGVPLIPRTTLDSAFGIVAIQTSVDGTTLQFANRPDPALLITDERGYPLDPVWHADQHTLVVKPVSRFRIRTPEFTFDVARVDGVVYRYDPGMGLKSVFDARGFTYFAFNRVPRQLRVVDERGRAVRGRRHGEAYRYRGTPSRVVITLDGATFEVTRTPVTRFYVKERRS
ncbi:MAG: TrbG/VirB9 family P-type conjugative transfer protein [Burkholderia sp.]